MTVAGKPISSYRPRARQPPPSPPRQLAIKRPPLWEFVLLSMLLHATAIMLFGAPSGGSREGRAMWGALQVVLQSAPVDAGPSLKIDRGFGTQRPDTVRPPSRPTPRIEPIAPPLKLEPRIEPAAPPVESPPAEPTPKEVAPIVIPALLDRIVAPERLSEMVPFRVPPPTPVQAAPAPVAPLPAAAAPEAPVPLPLPERVAAPPVEIAPVASPVIPALPATPPVERVPVEVRALPVPTLESIAPPRVEPASKPLERTTTQQMPIAVPSAPAPVSQPLQQREAPAKIDRAPATRDEPALQSAPFRPSGPAIDSSRNRAGDPSTTFNPTAPSLDLDAMRKRAGELARAGTGNRAILPFPMPPVPEKKSKMETAIENARKPDCRTAYANLGLAAVVPLIANEFGEGSCRW